MILKRKLLAITMAVFTAVLLFSLAACGGSGAASPSPSETKTSSAARLVFTAQPSGGTAGTAFSTQPVVAIQDAEGNLVDNYRGTIELTITGSTSHSTTRLYGATKKLAQSSTMAFENLSMEKAGDGYTLTASSGSLSPAVSAPFNILPGDPAKLAFSVQPPACTAGVPMTPGPEVIVQDHYGNVVTNFEGSVKVSATGYWDEYSQETQSQVTREFPVALSGATEVSMVNGVARFTNLSANNNISPRYTLLAVSDSLESATSAGFTMEAGAAAKLEITIQPSGAKAGKPFDTQPKVAVEDIYGNVANSAKIPVTVSITPASGAAGAVLSGTSTVISDDALGGLAEFEDLAIDLAGSGYTLTVTAEGLPSVQSQAFDVTAP